MIPLSEITLTEIYEQDYYLWLVKTLELVKSKDINQLDWEHLTEEIEALGNEQRRKVKSYLRQLLIKKHEREQFKKHNYLLLFFLKNVLSV